METKNPQQGAAVKNGTAQQANGKAHQNGEAKKENGASPKTETAATNGKAGAEPAKPAVNGVEKPGADNAEQPKAETVNADAASIEPPLPKEEAKVVRLALNLQGTLKVVEDLHRRSIQRVNLISRIKQLEDFEVNLAKENDELEENPYQGCKLIIQDDKHRQFATTTPGLIRMVSQFIFNACNEKLAEIEAHIVLPS